jgi:hypothetical protein
MNAITVDSKTSVKLIGANGQISLGKGYAGRQVLVEEREPGVWFVRTAIVIPENERWLHEPQAAASLQTALAWAAQNKPKSTNVDALFEDMNHGKTTSKPAKQPRSVRPQQPRVSKKPA